jgi:putative glutamine amidotransferase
MQPLIGITADEGATEARPGRPALPRYELKRAYADAVLKAGGLPLILPYVDGPGAVGQLLGRLDGLVVTGGAFDIGPEEYGEAARPKLGPVKPARTRFERTLLELALEREVPVLGVCGGMQLLNVVRGGTLMQDIGTELAGALPHEQAHDSREPAHDVLLSPGSALAQLAGVRTMRVNTTHHQAVARLGRGLVVSGAAPDGVVEAIELTGARFCVGVQWHPELLDSAEQQAIYAALVAAAGSRR